MEWLYFHNLRSNCVGTDTSGGNDGDIVNMINDWPAGVTRLSIGFLDAGNLLCRLQLLITGKVSLQVDSFISKILQQN